MNIIIFDFEVFKYDTLLGCLYIDEHGKHLFQSWDLDEIKLYYKNNEDALWVGHNNCGYDNYILDAILKNKNPYEISKKLINDELPPFSYVPKYNYDIMRAFEKPFSLKLTELLSGKSIETTEVDFDLDRQLNDDEKKKTEIYNQADLNQTEYNFEKFYHRLELRLDIINEFNLPLTKYLNATGTKIAAAALGAKQDPSLIYKKTSPIEYPNLKLENKKLKKFYYEEGFRDQVNYFKKYSNDEDYLKEYCSDGTLPDTIKIGNAILTLGSGGLHYAQERVHYDKVLYGDISGAYNSVMIEYNLLSRSIPPEGKEKYINMFKQEKSLKKTNPKKRQAYKTVLLAVYGAQMNENTDFFDPWNGLLTPITLQLFIIDLLEKLKDLVTFVQVNTDGIMMVPHDWNDEPKIQAILTEWQTRTKFQLKIEHLTNYYGRDVNNYCVIEEDGTITYKGEALKNYKSDEEAYASGALFNCKEPPIIAMGMINFMLYGIMPEDTVEKNKNNFIYYQYACKKNTFDYLTYDTTDIKTGLDKSIKVPPLCRVFALKSDNIIGMINKHKFDKNKGCMKQSKVSNLPDSVFIYNGALANITTDILNQIDYEYYINRIYEKLSKFL